MLQIRPETPDDAEVVQALIQAAFAHHRHSNQTEHLLVETLREADALSLALVAEEDGEVAGHIAFSPITIGGKACGGFILAPLSVSPAHQGHGIGRRLVAAGLTGLSALGANGCIVVGDPVWYLPCGFKPAPGLLLEGVPPENLMALSFGAPLPQGHVDLHPAFAICA